MKSLNLNHEFLIENKTDFVLRMFAAEKIAAVGILFSKLTS